MEPLFEIRFAPTHNMLAENIRKYGVGPRIPTVIFCTLAIAAMIGYVVAVGLWERMQTFVIILITAEMLLFFLPHILAGFLCWSGRIGNGGKVPQAVITVADTIIYQSGSINMCFEYKDLTGTVRLKHSYKLRFTNRRGLLLCPDGFTKGTLEEFKQFLREKRPDLHISQ